jgi:hypothetical protein
MPNWVTNKVKASKQVIEAMLGENSEVDFDKIIPSPCKNGNDWDGISCAAEEAAEIACGIPFSSNPLIASLQTHNRFLSDVKSLSESDFIQFNEMVENHKDCGYLHSMDFARKEWGTKWNACNSIVNSENKEASFDTAWSCPEPIFIALSRKFPKEKIEVIYADEDIGSNCGRFILLNGDYTFSDIAPSYQKQSEKEKKKWRAFACKVKGWNKEDYED